jgi:hypothetical protein
MPAVHALVALAALQAGDHPFMQRVLDDAAAPAPVSDPLARLCHVVRAVAAVVASDAAPWAVAELEDRFASLTDCHLLYARASALLAAHALLDLGSADAVRFAGHVLDLPQTGPVVRAETDLLRCRLSVVGGRPVTADAVLAHAGRVAAGGRARHAAVQALRLAHDLGRAGSPEEAAVLSEWAFAHLPGPKRRTPMEQLWCDITARTPSDGDPAGDMEQPIGVTRTSARGSGRCDAVIVARRGGNPAFPDAEEGSEALAIRLLHPFPRVDVPGREVQLPGSQARLVVFVALADPRPLHIEQVGDLLWPGVPLPQVRVRMNSLLYRLRRSLRTGDALIGRRGDLVGLREGACTIDLVELWTDVARGGAAAGVALSSVRSNICPAYEPYDEHLIEARRQFVAEWTAQARRALRHNLVTTDELVPAALALEVDLDELLPRRPRAWDLRIAEAHGH